MPYMAVWLGQDLGSYLITKLIELVCIRIWLALPPKDNVEVMLTGHCLCRCQHCATIIYIHTGWMLDSLKFINDQFCCLKKSLVNWNKVMVDFLQNIWSFSVVAAGNPCGIINVSQADLLAHLCLQPSPASCIGCTDVASNVMGVAWQVKMASECTTTQHSLHPVRCLCTRMTKTIAKNEISNSLVIEGFQE